jgi:hypothetical protein
VIKLLYRPFGIVGGVLAGIVSRQAYARVWRLIDRDAPPAADVRNVSVGKLALALLLEGAIFRAARGLFDHGSRVVFRRTTGRWPGRQDA